jgi:hypothetical protein
MIGDCRYGRHAGVSHAAVHLLVGVPMKRILMVLAICSAVAMAACGGDSTAPVATLDGSWSGPVAVPGGGGSVQFTLTLTQATSGGQHISGTGAFVAGTSSIPVTVTGSFSDPGFTLTLSQEGFEPILYTGTLTTSSRMTGAFNGSGFENLAVTLTKQ